MVQARADHHQNLPPHPGTLVESLAPGVPALGTIGGDNNSVVTTDDNGDDTGDATVRMTLTGPENFVVAQIPPPPPPLFSWDFEVDGEGFTATGAQLVFAAAVDANVGDTIEILIREVGTDLQVGSGIVPVASPTTVDWSDFGPFDLSAADGKNVYLEFRFQGTDAAYIGWYLDDIVVTAP